MSALIPHDEVVALDAALIRLSRGVARVRLRIGEALERLARKGGHHELGFSSFEAYARERCERSGRWAIDTRTVARRLQERPLLREALRGGQINWSMAELLAYHATSADEAEWLERSRNCTVREMREVVRERLRAEGRGVEDGFLVAGEACRRLTVTVSRDDAWPFECVRLLTRHISEAGSVEETLVALLQEGLDTLSSSIPKSHRHELEALESLIGGIERERAAFDAWCKQREQWRNEAEARCRKPPPDAAESSASESSALPETAEALDLELRRLCADLAERDLILGELAERARRHEVWHRLGFASEGHYVRERLGISRSSLRAKQRLATHAARLPELGQALVSGAIGYEAASLLARVVTPRTVGAWVERARQRTIKHLREEVEAAELLIRFGAGREQLPVDDQLLSEWFEVERSIASGDVQLSGPPAPPPRVIEGSFGNVTFRWHVSADTYRFWRALEGVFERVSPALCVGRPSFLRFLCENFCRIWLPALRNGHLTRTGDEPAYFAVYRRDRFSCTSPVCSRRDVTPHHLRFRAHGGGDEDENVASLCVWCHLRGIHEGRLRATPPASRIHWRIGRNATLSVDGRVRTQAR